MTMIEKVARAIAGVNEFGSDLLHKHYETDPEGFEELARAAVEAMKEPTTEMLDAVTEAEKAQDYDWSAGQFMSAEDGWPIMIDAALAESKEG